ncbi:MAG: ATP-binding cassette domain-containing protein, partial [Lachnospiraceae bacterium]|nr:ATP-binding cassette domain-containing protein [Lachnospiraceae bacterium]
EYVRTADGLISASAMCERFLFDKNRQYTPVAKLSGGEKRRLYLLRILMSAPNVLILDEPTNDLDIQTLQILEDYLDHFPGIVIAVSHDRYFLDRVVNRIFSFENDGLIHQSEGGYEDYLAHREGMETDRPDLPVQNPDPGKKKQRSGSSRTVKRLTYAQQREYDALEEEVDSLTERAKVLEEQIQKASSDYVKLQELTEEKAGTDRELDLKIERFLELQELLESFDS